MGFFQDLKQDLSQTVADINADETLGDMELDVDMSTSSEELFGSVAAEDFADVGAMLEKEVPVLNDEPAALEDEPEALLVSLDENESMPNAALEMDEPAAEEAPVMEAPVVEEKIENDEISEADVDMEELLNEVEQNIEESSFMEAAPQEAQTDDMEMSAEASTDTAVITSGMNITGDVTSSGNMNLIGNITGNIDILGKLNITGNIEGSSKASDVYAEKARINGDIHSVGSIKVGQSTVIIGNIFASSAVIAGAVKGDIDVKGPVILDTSAIVMGNIKSKSVQINNGAVIEGLCSQCYAEVNPSSFFEDLKKAKE